MKIQIMTLLLVASTTLTFAQSPGEKPEEKPFILVTGTAEKEVVPDEIYIGIVIRERYVNKEKVTIEQQEEKLKNAIKTLGIDLANLSLSNANANFVRIPWHKKDVLTRKDYTLKVADAETVGKIFQALDDLEIRDAFISKVEHSKIDSLRKEVKIEAIKDAKDKADYLLAAIGEQTGKPLIINEIPGQSINALLEGKLSGVSIQGSRINDLAYPLIGVDKERGEENNIIQFQKINIQTTILVKFSIK